MKTAVLLQGKLRASDDSIEKCIIHTKELLKDFDCDYYFFTWLDPDDRHLKYKQYFDYILLEPEPTTDFLESINWKWTRNLDNNEHARGIHRLGMYSIVHSIDFTLKFIDTLDKKYDNILRIRNDLWIETNFQTWFDLLAQNDKKYITAPAYWNLGEGSLNDHICLVKMENAKLMFQSNYDIWKDEMKDAWNFEAVFHRMATKRSRLEVIDAPVTRYMIKRPIGHPGCDNEGNWNLK